MTGEANQRAPLSVAVCGPTASGKTDLALRLAQKFGGEIINFDSVQIYRGFDIGSAKPSSVEQALVPHHLIDHLQADEECDAAIFANLARLAVAAISEKRALPLLVGGTGLYLRSFFGAQFHENLPKSEELRAELALLSNEELINRLQSLDPVRCSEIHPNDRYRLIRALELNLLLNKPLSALNPPKERKQNCFVIVLDPPRELLHQRIALRTKQMLKDGLIAETERLLALGVSPNCKPMRSIGYSQCVDFLHGKIEDEARLEQLIIEATRQYAKRQCTWFKKLDANLRLVSSNDATAQFEESFKDFKKEFV